MADVWSMCNLGDAMLAGESLERIRTLFLSEYGRTGCPSGVGIFFRHESEGRLHCELKVYFSPTAADIAHRVGAVPCHTPCKNGLGLLAGSEEVWSLLFQE